MNRIYLLSVVAIAVVCALFAWYKQCPAKVVVEEEIEVKEEEEEVELNEVEKRLFLYLEDTLRGFRKSKSKKQKAKTIDMVETVTELFNVNEVQFTTNDVVGFVRTVREWDESVGKLEQKEAEYMYNNINSLNIDSELFDILVHIHIKTCTSKNPYTVLFKRMLRQLTDEAIKGELFNVLFN